MAQNIGTIIPREITDGGLVADGYYIQFFEPDSTYTTKKTVYIDAAEAVAHADPMPINSSGFATGGDVYVDGLVDLKIWDGDPDGLPTPNLIRSRPNVGFGFSAVATDLQQLIDNFSFETDSNSDGTPDNWTLTTHANITVARSTVSPGHGAACLLFTVTGSGTADATSALFELSNLDTILGSMKVIASVAGLQVKAYLKIYDNAQALLSTQAIFQSTNNSTSWTEDIFSGITVGDHEVTGRYGALKLEVADNGNTGTVCFDGIILYKQLIQPAPVIPLGLVASIDADADHDLNFTAGSCKADDGIFDINIPVELTKQIDSTWAAGDDAGGNEIGFSIPSEDLFYIWAIASSTLGKTDILFSNSAVSPTMPTNYDKKRRIFAWPTDSSNNLLNGLHDGTDGFTALADIVDLTDATIVSGTAETDAVICPPNGEYFAAIKSNGDANWDQMLIEISHPDGTYSSENGNFQIDAAGSAIFDENIFKFAQHCDATSQLSYELTFSGGGTMQIDLFFHGFRDVGRSIL